MGSCGCRYKRCTFFEPFLIVLPYSYSLHTLQITTESEISTSIGPNPEELTSPLSLLLFAFLEHVVWKAYLVDHLPPSLERYLSAYTSASSGPQIDIKHKPSRKMPYTLVWIFRWTWLNMAVAMLSLAAGNLGSTLAINRLLLWVDYTYLHISLHFPYQHDTLSCTATSKLTFPPPRIPKPPLPQTQTSVLDSGSSFYFSLPSPWPSQWNGTSALCYNWMSNWMCCLHSWYSSIRWRLGLKQNQTVSPPPPSLHRWTCNPQNYWKKAGRAQVVMTRSRLWRQRIQAQANPNP